MPHRRGGRGRGHEQAKRAERTWPLWPGVWIAGFPAGTAERTPRSPRQQFGRLAFDDDLDRATAATIGSGRWPDPRAGADDLVIENDIHVLGYKNLATQDPNRPPGRVTKLTT